MAWLSVLLIAGFAVWHYWLRKPDYSPFLLVIRCRHGDLQVLHGRLMSEDLQRIREILNQESVKNARISLLRNGQVQFTGIPQSLQQLIRNILVNS